MTTQMVAAIGLGIVIGLVWAWFGGPALNPATIWIWRRYTNCVEVIWRNRDVW